MGGADKEGYWNSEKLMANVEDAAQNGSILLAGVRLFLFLITAAFSEDALNVKVMNVKPRGAQPEGRVQKLVDHKGVPKGMKQIGREGH